MTNAKASSSKSNNNQNNVTMDYTYALDPSLVPSRVSQNESAEDDDDDEEEDDEDADEDENDSEQEYDSNADSQGDASLSEQETDAEDEYLARDTVNKAGKVRYESGGTREEAPQTRKRSARDQLDKGKAKEGGDFEDREELSRIMNVIRTATGDDAGGRTALDQMYDKTIEEEMDGIDDPIDHLGNTISKGKKGTRRAAADVAPSAEVKSLLNIAMYYFHRGDYDDAFPKLIEIIRIDPNIRAPWFTLATIHEDRNEIEKALSFKIVGTHLTSVKSAAKDWAVLGGQSRNVGLLQQAIYCFTQAIKGDRGDVDSMWDRAFLLKLSGSSKLAISGFLRILEIHPHDRGVLRELGPLLAESSQVAKAADIYMKAFDYYRTAFSHLDEGFGDGEDGTIFNCEDLLALIDYLSILNRWTDVISVIRVGARWLQGREKQSAWDTVTDDREFDLERKSRPGWEKAVKPFEDAPVNELDPRLRTHLGIARLAEKNFEEADYHFKIILALKAMSPISNSQLHLSVASAYKANRMFVQAIDVWTDLAQFNEINGSALWNDLAIAYLEIGEVVEARNLWEQVVESDPANLEAKLALARMYEQSNEPKKAHAMLQEIMRARQQLREAGEDQVDPTGNKSGNKKRSNRPTLSKEDRANKVANKVATEAQRDEEFNLALKKLDLLGVEVNDDNAEVRGEWLAVATFLVDAFRETSQLFPADPRKKFTGVLSRTWKRKGAAAIDIETEADQMSQRLVRTMADQQDGLEVDSFRGLNFDGWLGLIIKYAFLLTKNDEHPAAQETLVHVQGASVFKQSEARTITIRLARAACYCQVADYQQATDMGRWFCLKYQLQPDPLRLLLALMPGGANAIAAMNGTPLQKFNIRQMRAVTAALDKAAGVNAGAPPANMSTVAKGKQKAVRQDAEDENDAEEEDNERGTTEQFKPVRNNPLHMMAHGMMLITSKSYQSAIIYFLRAYKFIPKNVLLNLCLGVCYLHRAMQRQTDNRHHQIAQALTFFSQYRKYKENSDPQEVEFNFGRAFHHVGLQHLAIKHYQAVLTLATVDRIALAVSQKNVEDMMLVDEDDEAEQDEPNDFAKLAAYNLSSLYMYSGSPELAREVASRWLIV